MKFGCPKGVDYDNIKDRMEMLSFSLATTPLELFKEDTLVDIATGFFFYDEKEDRIFLVTCKHCIIDEEQRFYPDRISIKLHTDINDLRRNARREIKLYKNGEPVWIEHENCDIDLALIEVDEEILKDCYIACFTKNDIFSVRNPRAKELVHKLEVGSQLLAVEYPEGLYDMVNNLPISRGAFLASKYTIWFDGKPCFLVDSYLPKGMSGSPVLTATAAFKRDITLGVRHYLAGILRGPLQTPYLTQRRWIVVDDIGLYYVFYADLLEEMLRNG